MREDEETVRATVALEQLPPPRGLSEGSYWAYGIRISNSSMPAIALKPPSAMSAPSFVTSR